MNVVFEGEKVIELGKPVSFIAEGHIVFVTLKNKTNYFSGVVINNTQTLLASNLIVAFVSNNIIVNNTDYDNVTLIKVVVI